jgi:hypothetical protein
MTSDQFYFFFAFVTAIVLSSFYVAYRPKDETRTGDFLACIGILGFSVGWFPFGIMGLALGIIYAWIRLILWIAGK